MITRKVALVLGAGASMPFGFPSGHQLKTEIIHELDATNNRVMLSNMLAAGYDRKEIEDFRTALRKSGKRSVDAFLEHRTEFLKVGKAATACALMPRERGDLFGGADSDWYEYFFNKLNTKFEDFEKNCVSVLTFNYDRSLEQYLLTALTNAYGKPNEECAKKLCSLPIIHLYGQLGELPLFGDDGIEYGAPVNAQNLEKCVSAIQIIHEDVSVKPQFFRAHDLLRNADRICVIGFGFDETNLRRLARYGPNRTQEVLGSAKDFTQRECAGISKN